MGKEGATQFAVLGLGRFGMSIVRTLADYDVGILACDRDAAPLHEAAQYVTHAVQADVSDEETMRTLGLGNFDVVVLAMGAEFEATLLAAMAAREMGARCVLARAYGARQRAILERVGVDRVVLPEAEMGARVARSLVEPNVVDLLEHAGRAITEMHPQAAWVGRTVGEANIRRASGYTVLAVIRGERTIFPVHAELRLEAQDMLIALREEVGKARQG